MRRIGTLVVLALVALAVPAQAAVLWEYDADANGAADPTSGAGGSWTLDAKPGVTLTPLTPDAPYPENAWQIDAPAETEHANIGVISGDMSDQIIADGGWRLTGRLRLIRTNMDPALGGSILQVRNSTVESPGTTWWRVGLGTDEQGNPIVGLCDSTKTVSETFQLSGTGYHTYVIEKNSADGNVDAVNVYADGVLLKENWDSGMVYTSRQQVVWGHNNRAPDIISNVSYNLVRLESIPEPVIVT